MRGIIKKILREYDELNWIDDVAGSETIVTTDNVYLGAKVRLNPESNYNEDEWFDQLGYAVGETVLYFDTALIYGNHDGFWVKVTWKTPNGNLTNNYYRIGPNDFDLVFAT
jgi:hypothetical protein